MQTGHTATLKSRTFIGLLLAQFTATFNDQAIHIVAIFYASDIFVRYLASRSFDQKAVVAIVTACFISPFLMFSPLAGVVADKYSKRSIIVFWKIAELFMMGLALGGLCLPHLAIRMGWPMPMMAATSAIIVISVVLLMGLHSTFFVPAKYGAMPEILDTSILSRGNGMLEGTSFMAQIFGTSAGAFLYAVFKSEIVEKFDGGPQVGEITLGDEWIIGALLLLLAGVGTCTSILMQPSPAADPNRPLTFNWWRPLRANLSLVWKSKPLMFAIVGISFAAFMTLFLRQTLLYEAETAEQLQKVRFRQQQRLHAPQVEPDPIAVLSSPDSPLPEKETLRQSAVRLRHSAWRKIEEASRESELRVGLLIALVGLGVGLGSLTAGYLSGHRVELGLVPIGALGMFVIISAITFMTAHPPVVWTCLFLIGIAAGVYIVPLYTLMQHSAPKERKGNVVAASNFLNVAGGIVAIALFYVLTFGVEVLLGARTPALHTEELAIQLENKLQIPQILYFATSLLTLFSLVLLKRRMPDVVLRSALFLRTRGRNKVEISGIDNIPTDGPLVLVTNASTWNELSSLVVAVDRSTRLLVVESPTQPLARSWEVSLARRAGLIEISTDATPEAWDRVHEKGIRSLNNGVVLILSAESDPSSAIDRLLHAWQREASATLLPVHCGPLERRGKAAAQGAALQLAVGFPLPADSSLASARTTLDDLGRDAGKAIPFALQASRH